MSDCIFHYFCICGDTRLLGKLYQQMESVRVSSGETLLSFHHLVDASPNREALIEKVSGYSLPMSMDYDLVPFNSKELIIKGSFEATDVVLDPIDIYLNSEFSSLQCFVLSFCSSSLVYTTDKKFKYFPDHYAIYAECMQGEDGRPDLVDDTFPDEKSLLAKLSAHFGKDFPSLKAFNSWWSVVEDSYNEQDKYLEITKIVTI